MNLRSFLTLSSIIIFAALTSISPLPAKSTNTNPLQQIRAASVEILIDGHLEGSGWFADQQGHIITAGHAVWDKTNSHIEIVTHKGNRHDAKIIAIDRLHDLALLKTNITPPAALTVAKYIPTPGSPVTLHGTAMYYHNLTFAGTVANNTLTYGYYPSHKQMIRIYHINSPAPPGASGGPWVDQTGNVVGNQSGFITAKNNRGGGLAMIAPPSAIANLIQTKTSPPAPTIGCGFEELWSQKSGFVKRFPPKTQGLITLPIEPNGPAKRAGLTAESVIIAMDDKPIRYRREAIQILVGKKPGDTLKLLVLKPDKPKPIKVTLTLDSSK